MSDFRIKVDGGKYEFVLHDGWDLEILRHGERWAISMQCSKAIHSMMCELDAARVVVAAVRGTVGPDRKHIDGAEAFDQLLGALDMHRGLVADTEPPSEWADSGGVYRSSSGTLA